MYMYFWILSKNKKQKIDCFIIRRLKIRHKKRGERKKKKKDEKRRKKKEKEEAGRHERKKAKRKIKEWK